MPGDSVFGGSDLGEIAPNLDGCQAGIAIENPTDRRITLLALQPVDTPPG
jgi:hypothetical protein